MSGEVMRTANWLRQYAIRMPNGELYATPVSQQQVENYSMPSYLSTMLGLGMGYGMPTQPQTVAAPGPLILPTYQAAKAKLTELRQAAHAVGVTVYGGEIVERLCTPFSTGDLTAQFGTDLMNWLKQQDGAQ